MRTVNLEITQQLWYVVHVFFRLSLLVYLADCCYLRRCPLTASAIDNSLLLSPNVLVR